MLAHLIEFITVHYLLSGAFLLLLALLLFTEARRGGKGVDNRELTMLLNHDEAMVLDIRSQKDFSAGHIVGSYNIPHDKLTDRIVEIEKYKGKNVIIVVDATGQHAGNIARTLKQSGYSVRKLSGGIASWRNDNLPVVK